MGPVADCTRRRFLAHTARCGAAALLAPGIVELARAAPLGGPVGLQLYAVKDSLQADPAATLRRVKEIGFGEVETAGFAGLTAQEFRKLLDEAGLACPSAHLDFHLDNLSVAFGQAHALGTQYAASGSLTALVRSATGDSGAAHSGMSVDEAHRTAALANHIGDEARRAGLQYVYHNHDAEFADQGGGAIGYDVLLKETDPALVQFEIDCGWMVVGGRNPRDYFERYPGRFPLIHVKDFLPPGESRGAQSPAHPGAELGHGMIDYRPIFAAAEKAGLKHYFAEQEGPFTRMSQLEAARQAFEYIRRIR
jgi:sugar phosphate isomerase/epimerase